MKKQNNRGAAMVTVLIAITFVTILTTSLLYAAYVNFLTKNTRTRSANNFYSDEFALDEVAASLQQVAAAEANIDDAHTAIRTAVGVPATATTGQYDPNLLASMIMMANKDSQIQSISVTNNCADPLNSYQETTSAITLKDVHITATGNDGYVSNIDTDIVINLPRNQKSGIAVNSFSVICDNTLYNNDDKSGNTIFCGNYYVSTEDSTQAAVKVDGGKFMQIIGEYAVINGDLHITGRSAMFVSGKFLINGTVTIDDNSSLVVGDEMFCKYLNIDGGSDAKVVVNGRGIDTGYNDHVHVNPTDAIFSGLPAPGGSAPGLAADLMAKHLWISDGGAEPFDVVALSKEVHGANKGGLLEFFLGTQTGGTGDNNGIGKTAMNYPADCGESNALLGFDFYKLEDGSAKAITASEHYKGMLGTPTTFNDGMGAYLLFTNRDLEIRNEMPEATLITTGKLDIDQVHTMYVPHMSDYGYQAVINTMIKLECNNDIGNTSTGVKNMQGAQFGYTNVGDCIENCFVKGGKCWEYDELSGAAPTTHATFDSTTSAAVDVASSKRYVVWEDNGGENINYIPYGYLLTSDTDSIIAKHIPMLSTSDESPKPTIQFKNWSKE